MGGKGYTPIDVSADVPQGSQGEGEEDDSQAINQSQTHHSMTNYDCADVHHRNSRALMRWIRLLVVGVALIFVTQLVTYLLPLHPSVSPPSSDSARFIGGDSDGTGMRAIELKQSQLQSQTIRHLVEMNDRLRTRTEQLEEQLRQLTLTMAHEETKHEGATHDDSVHAEDTGTSTDGSISTDGALSSNPTTLANLTAPLNEPSSDNSASAISFAE